MNHNMIPLCVAMSTLLTVQGQTRSRTRVTANGETYNSTGLRSTI